MPRCIYCLTDKPDSAFNADHVLPVAFGKYARNLTLNTMVCTDCNQDLGDTLEIHLGRSAVEGMQRYLNGMKPANEVRNFRYGDVRIQLAEGEGPPALFELAEDGGRVTVRVMNQVGFRLSDGSLRIFMEREMGEISGVSLLDPPAFFMLSHEGDQGLQRMLATLERQGINTSSTEPFSMGLTPGQPARVALVSNVSDKTKRAVAKIALNYLAYRLGPLAFDSVFDEIRKYIRFGVPPASPLVETTRKPFLKVRENESWRFPYHAIVLRKDSRSGRLIGQVTLFGMLSYVVRLADRGPAEADGLLIGHMFNPVRGKVISLDEELTIDENSRRSESS